jgi:hypothetical protein
VVDCCLCVGTGDKSHIFLEAEGFGACNSCGVICCLECICQNKMNEDRFCYSCFLPEVSVQNSDVELTLAPSELRDELRKYGVDATLEDDNNDLYAIYEAVRQNPLYDGGKINVEFPIKSANFLPQLENKSIFSFKLNQGGSFVVDDSLSSQQTLQIMTTMAQLVSMYDEKRNNYTDNTYKLVPTSIIRFAQGSRDGKDAGFRLVDRCIHNSADSQTSDINNAIFHVVENNDKMYFLIHHEVRASFKQNEYITKICFNHEELLACSCGCRAGCEGDGRVICVHVLPLIYQITHLLFDGLADSILVEYANRWKSVHSYEFIHQHHDEIKDNVMLLKTASQQYEIHEDNLEIHEILENFLVGTSKPKRYQTATDYSKLTSLREQNLSSHRFLARKKLNVNKTKNIISDEQEEQDQSLSDDEEPEIIVTKLAPATQDTYINICKTIAAFQRCCPDLYDDDYLEELTGFR